MQSVVAVCSLLVAGLGGSMPVLALAQTAERPAIVVMPLRSTTVEPNVGDALGDLLVSMVGELERYRVVSPRDVEAALGLEKLKDAAGCDDISCATELAGALGARYVLAGTINAYGSTLVLTSTLLDSQAAEAVGRANIKASNNPDAYYDAVRELVGKTFQTEIDRKLTGAVADTSNAQVLSCMRGDSAACAAVKAAGSEPLTAAAQACEGGAKDVCVAMAEAKGSEPADKLFAACEQGAHSACVALRDTGRVWDRGFGLRVTAYVLWAVGGSAVLGTTAVLGANPSITAYGKYASELVAAGVVIAVGGAMLVAGSILFAIGYLDADDIIDRAEQPYATALAPTLFPRPDGSSTPGLAFALQF